MKRRHFLGASAGLLVSPAAKIRAQSSTTQLEEISSRPIPSSQEALPVIGLGTWQTFDIGSNPQQESELEAVLTALVDAGGSVVDSSPMYGRSEAVVGKLASRLGISDRLFMATKVWTDGQAAGVSQMDRSLQRMGVQKMDLMQVHNLRDAEAHLQTLAAWKAEGKVRYTGITHYHSGGYSEMARLMRNHPIDFIQINYSMESRGAEQELFPLAKEKGIAVLINRPYEGGNLFARTRGKQLPEWAGDFDCESWGQFFLKFILGDEAVTCVIPGTSKLKHVKDNLAAGRGKLPTAKQRQAMLAYMLK